MGCSPDGIVSETKAIEVKCPFSKKDLTIEEACGDKSFFLQMCDEEPKLKRSHIYYFQCQGVMAVTGISELDFIVYTEKFMHIETLKFESEKWNTNWLPCLTKFYFDFMSNEIFKDT